MLNIFVADEQIHYVSFIKDANLVGDVKRADVVMFTGGEDVNPKMYGCKAHPSTYSNLSRDLRERAIFKSMKPSQLAVGICRGSQFCCCLNGGILVQNCFGHALAKTHSISNGEFIYHITSTHHQMQYPYNLPKCDYTVLYKAEPRLSSNYEGDKIDPIPILRYGEPEVVLYHKENYPKCLAIQGHPEMMPDSPVAKMLSDMIYELAQANNEENWEII